MEFTKIKELASSLNIEEVEVYRVKNTENEISTYNGDVSKNQISSLDVMALRGVYNNHIATVYVEDNSEAAVVKALGDLKDNASLIEKTEPYFIYEGSDSYPEIKKVKSDFDLFTQEDKINLCTDLEAKMKSLDKRISQTEVEYAEASKSVTIINSNGLDVSTSNDYLVVYAVAIATEGEDSKQGYAYRILDRFAEVDAESLAKEAVNKATRSFGAVKVDSGKYNVLFDREQVSTILRAYTGIFSAKAVQKNMSFLKDKVGEKVFGDNITIVDDPLDVRSSEVQSFDDEGVASVKTEVVKNGVLETYLHNLETASIFKTKSTSNGVKAGVAGAVGVGTTNFYLESTGQSFDELLELGQDGVYVTELMGAHAGVDTLSGAFSLQANGFRIRDGKLAEPLNLMIVSGNIKDVFNNVLGVSNEFKYTFGAGSGHMLVKGLNVSGK